MMKHFNKVILILIAVTSLTACRKYFDINKDPASPQDANLNTILPPVLANSVFQNAVDGVNAGTLIQNFTNNTGVGTYDIHAGNPGGSSGNGFWRVFYVTMGTSLNMIIDKGKANGNWDYVGVAYAMKAWGFQQATDYFGEIPFKQAWLPNRASFEYDKQEDVYKGIDSLLRLSLSYLTRNDGEVSDASLKRGDIVYNGDRTKWIKFVYGLLARHYNRLTNKSNYISDGYADSVIKFVDLSFASNADNFQVAYPATKNDDTNPFGPARGNFTSVKQSRFITQLLDGTIMTGSYNATGEFVPGNPAVATNRDPRLRAMLTLSQDTTTTSTNMPVANGGYRFNIIAQSGGGEYDVTPAPAANTAAARRRVSLLYGDSTFTNVSGNFSKAGRYVFQNSAPGTLMAYHELQFAKAEAAFRKGNKNLAYDAYIKGINGHFDFVNTYASLSGNTAQITAAQRAQYFKTPAVKASADALTITDIMLQKYIGDWAWNTYTSWADVRRYHYFDLDAETNQQVYRTFSIPFYSSTNLGPKPQYRFAPFINSEFDWNDVELGKIGAFNQDYHTYEMWFSQP